jgi:hypothetical protein
MKSVCLSVNIFGGLQKYIYLFNVPPKYIYYKSGNSCPEMFL